MKLSLIELAQQRRAKTLRLDESHAAPVQAPSQDDCKFWRKQMVIEIWEHCRDRHGLSMHKFIQEWGHKYSTGHGYLDRDEKRYPKPRSLRAARALREYLDCMADLDAEINQERVA